ncbi:hypothetical protein Hanom_Chr10g00892541 [Helianthus anomalus]
MRRRLSSYTTQLRCEYEPSISYATFFLYLFFGDPVVLTCASDFVFKKFTFFVTENRGFTVVSPSYTSQLSVKLNLCSSNELMYLVRTIQKACN